MPAFVDTYVSVCDIADCTEGHLLAAEDQVVLHLLDSALDEARLIRDDLGRDHALAQDLVQARPVRGSPRAPDAGLAEHKLLAAYDLYLSHVPDGNDDWRPHAKSRSLGELATTLTSAEFVGAIDNTDAFTFTDADRDGIAGLRDPDPGTGLVALTRPG